jgi:hypothetical protein
MSMRSICAQLLFVVLVAALFALPRTAQAHQGHAHAMHAHASHAHAPAQAAEKVQQDLAESHAEQSLTAASFSVPVQTHDVPCADPGCCAHGPCTSCCSMVAPILPLILPPALHVEIDELATTSRSGIDGPSLRRPPKSFA